MTKVRVRKDDVVNDLRLTNQTVVTPGNLLVGLLESDCVTIRNDNEIEQHKLKISDVSKKTKAISTTINKEEKKNGNSENNSGAVGVDSDVEKNKASEDDGYVKRIEYLIKWAGYDSESENTWESAENCVFASKRTEVDFLVLKILSVKKEHNEILAVGRFENGHHDLMSTRMLSANISLKFISS
uniref:Chromo domain-containing protein n=1 Tax=Wuchereria bancrofti TaxID=6293 RepID=A0AAF5PKH5_WUCBA